MARKHDKRWSLSLVTETCKLRSTTRHPDTQTAVAEIQRAGGTGKRKTLLIAGGKHHGRATLQAGHSLAMRPSTHTPGHLPSWFQSSCVHSDLLVKLHHNHACVYRNQTATKVPSAGNKPIGWTTWGNKKKRASRSQHGQLHRKMTDANLKKTTYCTVPSLPHWRKCSYRELAVIARAWTGEAREGE